MSGECRYKIIEGLEGWDCFYVGNMLGIMNRLAHREIQQATLKVTYVALQRVKDALELTENTNYNFAVEPVSKDSCLCTITLRKPEEQ